MQHGPHTHSAAASLTGALQRLSGFGAGRWFLVFALLWSCAAYYLSRNAMPGLLDDGGHMLAGQAYLERGILGHVADDIAAALWLGARFYAPQYALLGTYYYLFHLDLTAWYLANEAICLLTGALIFLVVRRATRSPYSGLLAGIFFLISSPVAETVRANFGKAEAIMTFCYVLSLHLWLLRQPAEAAPPNRLLTGLRGAMLATGGFMTLLVSAVSKESGGLLAGSVLLAIVLAVLFYWRDRRCRAEALVLGPLTMLVLAVCVAFRSPGNQSAYLQSYFKLDWSAAHVSKALKFYSLQNPDIVGAIVLLAISFGVLGVRQIRSRKAGFDKGNYWYLFLSAFGVATLYMALLLSFRFNLTYYAYVPAALLALAVGWVVAQLKSTATRALAAAALFGAGCYTVPFNFDVAAAQGVYDLINFRAMQEVNRLQPSRVILLDLADEYQPLQEWYLLGKVVFGGRLPLLFGASPNFRSDHDMDAFRGTVQPSDPSPADGSAPSTRRLSNLIPQPGDLVAVRSGELHVGRIFLRGVMPQYFNPDLVLTELDQTSLERVSMVTANGTRPWLGVHDAFDFNWNFYRVTGVPRYVVVGRSPDGWMGQDAQLDMHPTKPGAGIELTVELPGAVFPFPITITASQAGRVIATFPIPGPGQHRLLIPVDQAGLIDLSSNHWYRPAQDGTVDDPRPISYRVMAVRYADDISELQRSVVLVGRDSDGWMSPHAQLVLHAKQVGRLDLTIEMLDGLPIQYPLEIAVSKAGQPVTSLRIDRSGVQHLFLPVDGPESFDFTVDHWFQPSSLGISPDTRLLSYRVTGIAFEEVKP